ncbi:MAG: hypothetical protein K8W52_47035 [Deltaproteobacteria bacterium]|nr:hypothetical protein [Deltaproteobacteria bacterium]
MLVRDRRWVTIGADAIAFDVTLPDSVPPDDILVSAGEPPAAAPVAPPPRAVPNKHGLKVTPPVAAPSPLRPLIGAIDVVHAERADGSVWLAPTGSGLSVQSPTLAIGGGAGPHLTARISAAKPGRYPIDLVYVTDAMAWHASYTLVADGATGALHGSIAIDNRGGPILGASRVAIVDDALVDDVRDALLAIAQPPVGEPAPTIVLPGSVDLGAGELAIDAVGGARAVGIRQVLVYDPVSARFDAAGRTPMQDESYGVIAPSPAVSEAVELAVAPGAPLPAGSVRLVERDGGQLRLRGTGTLRTDGAGATTISVGRASDVVGTRRRVDFSVDVLRKRLVEEFQITIANRGARAVPVVVREHPYRGYQWHLAYASTEAVTKEAPQLLAFRAQVPAGGEVKIDYVVVYTW